MSRILTLWLQRSVLIISSIKKSVLTVWLNSRDNFFLLSACCATLWPVEATPLPIKASGIWKEEKTSCLTSNRLKKKASGRYNTKDNYLLISIRMSVNSYLWSRFCKNICLRRKRFQSSYFAKVGVRGQQMEDRRGKEKEDTFNSAPSFKFIRLLPVVITPSVTSESIGR